MNKIKKSLIEKSNRQEIHDLSEKIVSNVNTDKVIFTASKKPSWFKPFLKVALPSLGFTAAAVLLTVAIMYDGTPNGPTQAPTPVEMSRPSGSRPQRTSESTSGAASTATSAATSATSATSTTVATSSTGTTEEPEKNLIIIDSDYILFDTYAKEVSSLMDIALSLTDCTFTEPELNTDSNYMTESEEKYLVNDLNSYMDSLEGMLGINSLTTTCVVNQDRTVYDYDYLLTITIQDSTIYSVYYNDTVTNTKNEGQDNYKVDSDIEGVVVYNDKAYNLTGSKRVESGSQEFRMNIQLDDKYISVREDLSSTNYYRFEYYDNNDNLLKYVDIEQKKTEIDFQNAYDKTVLKLNEDNSINCKIKSRESDRLTITNENDVYTYSFKNSGNIYKKTKGQTSCL